MTDESDVYICGICKKEFQDFVTFLQHKSSFGVFKCKLCNLSYHDREDIQKHINASHSNQKVDVAFTIPTKASVVTTRSEPPDPSTETQKSGYAMSVFTCRLCNRFTLIERSMLNHLTVVHKIHVAPGSVELAALMLCSKPLDASSIPKLPGAPVVKTVTAPVLNKMEKSYQTIATQTKVSMMQTPRTYAGVTTDSPVNVKLEDPALTKVELGELSTVKTELDEAAPSAAAETAPDLAEECIGLQQDVAEVSTTSMEDEPVATTAPVGGSENDSTDSDVVESKPVKMTSILKTSKITYSKAKPQPAPAVKTVVEHNPVVCIDGGHDYTSTKEMREAKVESVDNSSTEQASAVVIEESPTVEAVTVSLLKEAAAAAASSSTPVKRAVAKPTQVKLRNVVLPPKTSPVKKTAKVIHVVVPKAEPKETPAKRGAHPVSSDESEEEDFTEEQQPGPDGMYHCRRCNRAFARERQYKAHMNVHVMNVHYDMESAGGNRSEGKSTPSQRKRARIDKV